MLAAYLDNRYRQNKQKAAKDAEHREMRTHWYHAQIKDALYIMTTTGDCLIVGPCKDDCDQTARREFKRLWAGLTHEGSGGFSSAKHWKVEGSVTVGWQKRRGIYPSGIKLLMEWCRSYNIPHKLYAFKTSPLLKVVAGTYLAGSALIVTNMLVEQARHVIHTHQEPLFVVGAKSPAKGFGVAEGTAWCDFKSYLSGADTHVLRKTYASASFSRVILSQTKKDARRVTFKITLPPNKPSLGSTGIPFAKLGKILASLGLVTEALFYIHFANFACEHGYDFFVQGISYFSCNSRCLLSGLKELLSEKYYTEFQKREHLSVDKKTLGETFNKFNQLHRYRQNFLVAFGGAVSKEETTPKTKECKHIARPLRLKRGDNFTFDGSRFHVLATEGASPQTLKFDEWLRTTLKRYDGAHPGDKNEMLVLWVHEFHCIFAQIVAAVSFMSRCGVLHNDLKPDNIFIELHESTVEEMELLIDKNQKMIIPPHRFKVKIYDYDQASWFRPRPPVDATTSKNPGYPTVLQQYDKFIKDGENIMSASSFDGINHQSGVDDRAPDLLYRELYRLYVASALPGYLTIPFFWSMHYMLFPHQKLQGVDLLSMINRLQLEMAPKYLRTDTHNIPDEQPENVKKTNNTKILRSCHEVALRFAEIGREAQKKKDYWGLQFFEDCPYQTAVQDVRKATESVRNKHGGYDEFYKKEDRINELVKKLISKD